MLLENIKHGQSVLREEFRRLPRQFHPGDPEMSFVKTADMGIRPGANLQVLSTEDGFIQVVHLVTSPTDQGVIGDVMKAAVEQRPAEMGPLVEIVTDGGYASWTNADACSAAGAMLRTPARKRGGEDSSEARPGDASAKTQGNEKSSRAKRSWDALRAEVLAALQAGPLRRAKLRQRLSMQNARLGRLLMELEREGAIRRGPGGLGLTEANDTASPQGEPMGLPASDGRDEEAMEAANEEVPEGVVEKTAETPDDSSNKVAPKTEAQTGPVRIPLHRRSGAKPSRPPRRDLDSEILALLAQSSIPMSRKEIRKAIKIQNHKLGIRLAELQSRGVIERGTPRGWVLVPGQTSQAPSDAESPATKLDTNHFFQWVPALETFLCPIG